VLAFHGVELLSSIDSSLIGSLLSVFGTVLAKVSVTNNYKSMKRSPLINSPCYSGLSLIIILSFILIFIPIFSFSQDNSIKDFDLKNYKAPDIKYRLLELGSNLSTNGYSESANNDNNFGANADLNYFLYRNTKKVQSKSTAALIGSYYASWNKTDTVYTRVSNPKFRLYYSTETRLYNKNNAFFGLHGDFNYSYLPYFSKSNDDTYKFQYHDFSITPFISVGKGKIEPIESARMAMDILLSLQKEDRLSQTPDSIMIDSLAQLANQIRYKRFYDLRFKRIYQLKQLDEALQKMDLVEIYDMVYFANLSDIWNYTPQFNRGTGTRFEGGVIPKYSINYINNHESDEDKIRKHDNKEYGIYGFFSFNRMKPVSYAWQSDILIDLTFGYGVSDKVWTNGKETNNYYNTSLEGLLNIGWQFGYYPNTRTYAGIKPYSLVSYSYDIEEKSKDVFGLNTGFRFNSYYYISPRLRIELVASLSYLNNFSNTIPSPFWNKYYSLNYNSTPVEKGWVYNLFFNFRYSIF